VCSPTESRTAIVGDVFTSSRGAVVRTAGALDIQFEGSCRAVG
jgi:hypothetical protein